MDYFHWKLDINMVDIIVNLMLVVITTGVTYYIFTYRPKRKRLNSLTHRLSNFRESLHENILDSEQEFKASYELYEETVKDTDGSEWIWSLIKIRHRPNFFQSFRFMTLMDVYFTDYWQGNELATLINALVMDDERYIELSTNISKLSAHIVQAKTLAGNMTDDIWKLDHVGELIQSKEDNEHVAIIVNAIEEIYETSKKIVDLVDTILNS